MRKIDPEELQRLKDAIARAEDASARRPAESVADQREVKTADGSAAMIALAAVSHQLIQGPLFQEFLMSASALSRIASGNLPPRSGRGVLLAAVAALALRLLPRTPAAVRFAVWFAVFALVAALPFVTLAPHTTAAAHSPGLTPWLTIERALDSRHCGRLGNRLFSPFLHAGCRCAARARPVETRNSHRG